MLTKPIKLIETFIIATNDSLYFVSNHQDTISPSQATVFPTINTALQFNRIINGRIITLYNGV